MSYTKQMFDKYQEDLQAQELIDADYQYQMWKEKQILNYEQMLAERDEDYYREMKEEQFEKDLNNYYENYYNIWD